MISAILYIIFGSLGWIMGHLPDVSTTTGIGGAITSASPYLSTADQILPVATLIAIISFDVVFWSAYWVYQGIYWIIKKIPTIS